MKKITEKTYRFTLLNFKIACSMAEISLCQYSWPLGGGTISKVGGPGFQLQTVQCVFLDSFPKYNFRLAKNVECVHCAAHIHFQLKKRLTHYLVIEVEAGKGVWLGAFLDFVTKQNILVVMFQLKFSIKRSDYLIFK